MTAGTLHGFYFEGNDRLRVRAVSEDAYALDASGTRYRLDISPVGGCKWDIVLADGAGVSSGTLTCVFYFATDFAEAGYLAATTTAEGKKLAVFNWSPVQWDEAAIQDHYTLKILTSHPAPVDRDIRQYVAANGLILTEKWVNDKFRIDYQVGPHETAIPVDVDHLVQGPVTTDLSLDMTACHDACHSACHSACVSGGSH